MSQYHLLDLPRPSTFRDSSLPEAKELFDWFLNNRQQRLDQLSELLRVTSVKQISLDFTPESLDELGIWLRQEAQSVLLTEEELQAKMDELPPIFRAEPTTLILPWRLSQRTKSICWDMGIYLGEMLIKHHPSLQWQLWRRKDMDLHQPTVVYFPPRRAMNPVECMFNIASRAIKGDDRIYGIRTCYASWAGFLSNSE